LSAAELLTENFFNEHSQCAINRPDSGRVEASGNERDDRISARLVARPVRYAGGDPVAHLIPGHGGPADRTGETIDHVGFRLADHDGMRRKLDGLGIPYSRMELPELGERRLFIRTPTGILLELVFRDTKAASPSTHQEQTNDQ
jgi:catechol 2,3-dioxygenase-like lactoylglutathione lyase family enzyme